MVPTILLFFPYKGSENLQAVVAAWQPAPALVSCFTYVFAKLANAVKKKSGHNQHSLRDDMFHLRAIYQTTGTIAACIHLSVVISCCVSNETSLMQIFIPRDSFARVETLADGAFVFFQNDFLLVTAACFIWSLVNIADLHRAGLSRVHWKVGLGYLISGFVLIGPGASAAALWFWREDVMSRRKAIK